VIRLALRVRPEDAEVALAQLLELCPNGVEEAEAGELVEYAVYGAPGELPELPTLRAAAGEALVEVETREVPDDWFDAWKRFHEPVTIGGRLHLRPPWSEPPRPAAELHDVAIDPGRAFGTGSHHTTRLCLELLLELDPGGALADLGCGTGVLAIAAARLGWEPVVAVDHEADAVDAALANARANGVALDVRRTDLRRDPLPEAATVVANLLRPLLLTVAERLRRPPRALVAGGLLHAEADEVAAAFARHGLAERDRRHAGEWAALRLEAPGGVAAAAR
jgi:ribosomal protein L11 methyltransferase